MDYPRLRPVDAFPLQQQGQTLICIRDPLHLTDHTLLVPYNLFFILTRLDGTHSVLDMQAEYMQMFGELLFSHQIEEIIQQLDTHYFLENERFQEFRRQVELAFLQAPVREAAHAGASYPAHHQELAVQLQSFFAAESGPCNQQIFSNGERVRGIIAPHIDLRRGGPCAAWAYKAIAEAAEADLFIIFGTGHTLSRSLFTLTEKDFATPLGVVQTDTAFVKALAAHYSEDLFQEECTHKQEHSIEFQVVFLSYLFAQKPIRIVPVLCGSFHEMIMKGISPRSVPRVAEFISALQTTIVEQGKSVCYIAGVDLAHVGQKFGDQGPLTSALLQTVEVKDRALLQHVQALDAEGFFSSIQQEQDCRRICGLSSIYTMLSVMEAQTGKLLRYEQAVEPETHSTVSYASLAFF